MKILVVDDEKKQIGLLEKCVEAAVPECEITCFQKASEALEWAKDHPQDIAFLDIQMPVTDGISLGKELKKIHPETNLIFVTGCYEDYVMDALPLRFSGYLQKPATKEAVENEIRNLRYPLPKKETHKLLTVRCFGEFEVFCNGKPVEFAHGKTKELLAYLIDRKGARVNGKSIRSVIFSSWENENSSKSNLRKCAADLRKTLKEVHAGDVFVRGFDRYVIDSSLVECDYYDWERSEPYAIRAFRGEYMSQYSWAKNTLAGIMHGD